MVCFFSYRPLGVGVGEETVQVGALVETYGF